MRRYTALAVALLAAVALPQSRPDWPQPIVKGTVIVWGSEAVKGVARQAFDQFSPNSRKIFVLTGGRDSDTDDWGSVLKAKLVQDGDISAALAGDAFWIESVTQNFAKGGELAAFREKGSIVAVSETDLAKGTFDGLVPFTTGAGAKAPSIGLELDDDAVLVVNGRMVMVRGEGKATFTIPAHGDNPAQSVVVQGRDRADLVSLRRRAIEQALPKHPVEKPGVPEVKSGTLFIVGGGGMPDGLLDKFIEACGGPDAPIVYVPCEFTEAITAEPSFVRAIRARGAKNVTWIHTKDRTKADKDEEFLKPLKDAKGVWYGGGRQWNLVDSYMDTRAHEMMKDVLKRGGAIGGSSAGASIQAELLARGDPLGNTNIIAPGYLRGLGFLPGAAVDQHFTQRSRHVDMTALMTEYPQYLGIGIDEATAIVVTKTTAEVTGKGQVFFYDYRTKPTKVPDYTALKTGEKYDLKERRKIEP